MKIFVLNDIDVRNVRKTHPALKGRKLLASGQFSGVFESGNPDTVLKLSIDDMGYKMLFGAEALQGDYFVRTIKDYGIVGHFTTSKNLPESSHARPKKTRVPMYLYEIERLHKVPSLGENRRIINKLCKRLRELDTFSVIESRSERGVMCLADLSGDRTLTAKPELSRAIIDLAEFLYKHKDAFADLHTGNFMQRKDGTLVLSDPVGSAVIYCNHNAFKPVAYNAPIDIDRISKLHGLSTPIASCC